MSTVKRLVCLANSRKLSGRCVAGKELQAGKPAGWVRPVSAREHEEVSEYERQYPDGSDPEVLDILDVPLIEARPKEYQQENWLLDSGKDWEKVSRMGWSDLPSLIDPAEPLWINGFKTFNGFNDRVPLSMVAELGSSLKLVHVDRMKVSVFRPQEAFGNPKRRVQGRFQHCGEEYRLWVTDPVYERVYLARPDGEYDLGEGFLTVSLGEPFNGACHKLIAAIIQPDRGAAR